MRVSTTPDSCRFFSISWRSFHFSMRSAVTPHLSTQSLPIDLLSVAEMKSRSPVCHNEVIENAVRRIVSNVRAEKAHFHEHTRFRTRSQQRPGQLPAVGSACASKQEGARSPGDPESYPTTLLRSRQTPHP